MPPGFYGEAYFHGPGKDPAVDSGYRDYARPAVYLRQAALAFALALLLPFRSVLDVGCALGYLVHAMGLLGKRSQGVEISEYAVASCLDSVREKIREGTVLDLPFPDRAFDLAVAQEVLEHVAPQDLQDALEELKRVSRKLIFLTVPLADWTEGLVPPERLPRDARGNPHHGHLTVADRPWWDERLAEGLAPWRRIDLTPWVSPRPDQGVFAFARETLPPPPRKGIRAALARLMLARLFG